jgi:hypothetical protein
MLQNQKADFLYGTIPILRQHIFGLFLIHPTTHHHMAAKLAIFLTLPTQSLT